MPAAARLAHADAGSGPTVVFLHPFPLDGRLWEAEVRAAVARGWRAIAPDLAGFGRSASPEPPCSVDGHADDVASLLAALGIDQAVLAGMSMGGYVALAVLRRHPRLARALALCDTRATADSAAAREGRAAAIDLVRAHGAAALVETLAPKLLSPTAGTAVVARVREIGASQPPAALVAALEALRDRPDASEALASFPGPVLCVGGAQDALTPPDEMRAMAATAKRGEMVVLEGAGHLSNLEAPDAFGAALLDWLERLAPRR